MRKQVKTLAGSAILKLGLLRRLMRDAGLVVAFHRVNDDNADDLTCSVSRFERFCDFFRRNFDAIPLSEFVGRMEARQSLAGQLAITFDDGYRDNFEHAAPILRSFDLPATFFVVSHFIATDRIAWWDRGLDPKPSWMTWEEVAKLASMGFEIGAHTRTHADLSKVVGERAREEILGSKIDLEARIGGPITLFAYPYGRADELLEPNRLEVRKAGFRCCAACCGGLVRTVDDPFRLNRVAISGWYQKPEQLAFDVAFNRT